MIVIKYKKHCEISDDWNILCFFKQMNVEKNYDKHFCFYITASDMYTVLSTDENTLVQ